MKTIILCVLAGLAAFGQAQTPLTIYQSAGSATGALRLQERRTNGTDYVGIAAPDSVATSLTWLLPSADGSADQCLDTDGAGTLGWTTCSTERLVSDYAWTQTMGARSGSGAVTLTFTGTACPAAGADSQYVFRVYESATPTTDELAISDGTGTCTRGGSGTIVATGPTGTYTNAIAASASGGWQEAMFSVADSQYVRLRAGIGNYEIYSDILTEDRAAGIICDRGATLIPKADNLKIFWVTSPSAVHIDGCIIDNSTYAHTGVTGVYLNNPDGSTFGGRIERMSLSYLDYGIHMVTGYLVDVLNNRVTQADTAAIRIENIDTGDAGIGLIAGNNMSCVTTCAHGLWWNSPGALQFKNNGLNGFTEQVTLEPMHGYATAADDGADTVLTWQSGNRFRSSMVGQSVQIGDSASCTIDAYTSSTVVRCNGQNLGTITNQRYYVGGTGQVQVIANLLDGGANTTYGVRWLGGIYLTNSQLEQNFIANYTVAGAKGISIEGSGLRIGSIKNNNIQATALASTIGIDITGSAEFHVSGNQVYGHATGMNFGASALYLQVEGNRCSQNATACFASSASTARIREAGPITYAQLAALTAQDGSEIYCSDCKATSTSSATCATGGSGALAHRLNSAWKCFDGTGGSLWTATGSDVYRAAGKVGVAIAAPLAPLDAFGTSASPATTGTATTGILRVGGNATNAIDFGLYSGSPYGGWVQVTNAGALGTTYPLALNPVGGNVGIANTNPSTTLDVTGTGRFSGLLTATSGFSAAANSTITGGYSLLMDRAARGNSQKAYWTVAGNSSTTGAWSTGTTPSGAASRWVIDHNGTEHVVIDEAGLVSLSAGLIVGQNVTTTGTETAARFNATGSNSFRVAGTDVIDSSRNLVNIASATMTDLTINTATPAVVGYVWTATSTGGAGSWQVSPASQWTTSSSDIYYTTGNVRVGSASATIGAVMELQSGSTVNILQAKYTGASGTGSGGGYTAHQGTTPSASGHRLGFFVFGAEVSGTQYNRAAIAGRAAEAWTFGAAEGAYMAFETTSTGSTSRTARWRVAHDGHLLPEANNTYEIAENGTRVKKIWTVDLDVSGTCTGCGSSSLPVADTTAIVEGSVDATKLMRFEVDGFSTGTTRVLTPQNGSYIIAGTDFSNTFTQPQTFNSSATFSGSTITASSTFSSDLIPTTGSVYALGGSTTRWIGYFNTLNSNGQFTFGGNLIPASSSTYSVGSSSVYPLNVYANYIEPKTELVLGSGIYTRGDVIPATNVTYSLGNSSFKWSAAYINNAYFYGNIQAPSGSNGQSATITVRDSAGTGTCTLIFSGGLKTGGTC